MPISKIKTSSITADAASVNLNIDANTLFLDVANNRVGVGTTSPYRQLQIGDYSTNAVMALGSSATSTGTFCFASSDSAPGRYVGTIAYDHQANAMIFGVNAVEAARFNSSGNLGIGTSSPLSKLDVAVEATLTRRFLVNYDDSVVTIKSGNNSSNPESLRITGDNIRFNTGTSGSGTERMRIFADGNVGIGTTSPTTSGGYTSLSINNATNSGYVVLQNNGTNKSDWYVSGGTGPAYLRGVGVALGLAATGANNIVFETNAAERMRISSTGNLAFGTSETTVAKVNIQLAGTSVSGDTTGTTMGAGAIFQLNNTNASQTNSTIMLLGGGTSNNVGQISSGIGFSRENENNWGTQLRFYTHNSATDVLSTLKERMRIDSNGLLNINTTSDIADAYVQVSIDSAVRGTAFVCRPTANTTVNAMVFRNSSNGNAGYIQYNASTTTYVTSSDYRLKENVAPMTGALAKVSQLKPCTFTWKADGSAGQGFIAHELAEVCPQAVTGEKDALRADGEMDTQGVDTSFLVATLTAAMQEQQTLITQLTERIAALENK